VAAGDPQISWGTIVGAIMVVGTLTAAQWTVFQTQYSALDKRVTTLESEQTKILGQLAHDPVEQRTFEATNNATAKQIDLLQAQIQDINRQIAAALIIIDNNSMPKKNTPALPP
jgi:septal ring factor EnvC (AmiA/AmiB activator)